MKRKPILSNNFYETNNSLPKKSNKIVFFSCNLDKKNFSKYEACIKKLKSFNQKQTDVLKLEALEKISLCLFFQESIIGTIIQIKFCLKVKNK